MTYGMWTEYQSCIQQEVWTCRPVDLRTCGLWVVDRRSIMHIAGGVDLWTLGPVNLWAVDRISIMYLAGPVDLVSYGLWTAHVCNNGCSPYSRIADLR